MILNGCRDLALTGVRRFWMRTLAAGQSEVERVSRRTVDVVAMLYPTPVVVIGRTRHRQQRRPLLLAQRVRLGGGGGTCTDRLLRDLHVDAVRPQQLIQPVHLEILRAEPQ